MAPRRSQPTRRCRVVFCGTGGRTAPVGRRRDGAELQQRRLEPSSHPPIRDAPRYGITGASGGQEGGCRPPLSRFFPADRRSSTVSDREARARARPLLYLLTLPSCSDQAPSGTPIPVAEEHRARWHRLSLGRAARPAKFSPSGNCRLPLAGGTEWWSGGGDAGGGARVSRPAGEARDSGNDPSSTPSARAPHYRW
jgi:hypothetical protein